VTKIILPRGEWLYDPSKRIGQKGGFGEVFEGVSEEHGRLAVKRLKVDVDAHREMRIATELVGREFKNIVPFLDAGPDNLSGAYFVVMPKADRSLQDDVSAGIKFDDLATARVLLEILNGLLEVSEITHRDLKPANVLFHKGAWKVADFGIARFVEDSTSLQTLKGHLSPPYAAPEQWNLISATPATDLYALGCLGYALLTGKPPFSGTNISEQHLYETPPPLQVKCEPQLKTLLSMLLRKVPSARPEHSRVKDILINFLQTSNTSSGAFSLLAQAGAEIGNEQVRKESEGQQKLSEFQIRTQLSDAGIEIMTGIVDRLFKQILNLAPVAEKKNDFSLILGQGKLDISQFRMLGNRSMRVMEIFSTDRFSSSEWDVISGTEIVVSQQDPEYRWSSSLWYCKLPRTSNYRWYEASYFPNPLQRKFNIQTPVPYSLTQNPTDADMAAGPAMHTQQLAFGPTAIDDENEDEFIERWVKLLALAALGKLRRPDLPLQTDFWRRLQ
jgi:serine/threonine protein kinase